MKISIFQKAVLLVAGASAIFVGGSILASPDAFYSAYDVSLSGQVSLLNELRASGGSLLILGFLILAGVIYARFTLASTLLAAAMFLAYGATRLLSLSLDGRPDGDLVTAMIVELLIGAACLSALIVARKSA